jgi:hypothetical protein
MEYELEHTKDKSDRCLLCHHKKVEGADYCPHHGANKQIQKQNKKELYEFQKTAFLARTIELAKHTEKYTLTIELGVQRSIFEQLLNKIDGFETLLRYNAQINATTQNIRNLVNDSLKLDAKIGELISKDSLIEIMQQVVDIIVEEIDDPDTVANIVDRINGAISAQDISR